MQNGIFFCKSLPENRICASFTIWRSQNCTYIQTSKIFSGKCNISGCSIVYIVKGFFVGWRTPQKWAVRNRPKGTEMWNNNTWTGSRAGALLRLWTWCREGTARESWRDRACVCCRSMCSGNTDERNLPRKGWQVNFISASHKRRSHQNANAIERAWLSFLISSVWQCSRGNAVRCVSAKTRDICYIPSLFALYTYYV